MSADFKKWRSIGRIQDYLEEIDRKYQYTETRMNAKVKLHGTNAGIIFHNGEIKAQKTNTDLYSRCR